MRRVSVPFFLLAWSAGADAQSRVLDDFSEVSRWTAHPSDGVSLRISRDSSRVSGGSSLRLDYDFHGGSGYAIARREIAIELPNDYEFSFWIRGDALPQNLEFKLVDASGDNVWWINRRDFRFPPEWTRVVTRKRHIEFAWGPTRTPELSRVSAIEFAITAGSGGRGTVWLDELALTPRAPALQPEGPPLLRASSETAGGPARLALDGDTLTAWAAAAGAQTLDVDMRGLVEFSAMLLRWAPGAHATAYEILASHDGSDWISLQEVTGSAGGTDYLYTPESEARFIRLRLSQSASAGGYALRELEVKPLDYAATTSAFFEHIAADHPRGRYPRHLLRTQSYWTVVGMSGDHAEALVNQEGMIEPHPGEYSIEPFLFDGGRLLTWHDATRDQFLTGDGLPIPSVLWKTDQLSLAVTAFVVPPRDTSTLWIRYRLMNLTTAQRSPTLYLSLRPFQVNPPWQFLNLQGGVGRISSLQREGREVVVNGTRRVALISGIAGFGALHFDQGDITDYLAHGRLPDAQSVADERGWASGALAYDLHLPSGGHADVWLAVPLHDATVDFRATPRDAESLLATETSRWARALDTVWITLPPSAARVANSIRSNLAYILINRDGPAIQPGSRSYSRSWIRDGALTSEALLRLGHTEEVREYIEWYAPFQFASGKVPCCVDRRGADPVPENDSHGQLIYLIAEYWRFTHDTTLVERLWPHVARAVSYMDSLRHSRMTPVYRADSIAYYGLMPESISHEGYSAKPMHSFWDNFFALKGFRDAALLARVLGKADTAARFATIEAEFRRDMLASFRRAMTMHGIQYLPGSVELGDFDATSTTVGIAPAGELANLPPEAVRATFDLYWERFLHRRDNDTTWEAYTPYEHRVIGTFVRLGQPDRARALLDFFMRDQRPAGWNHWAEVVFRDSLHPGFIGDMPHTWVGSDFIRSVLDMFAYERESDSSLVIAAGIPRAWTAEAPGVAVRGLRTHYGPISYTMHSETSITRVRLDEGIRTPPGGIRLSVGAATATVNGSTVQPTPSGEIILRQLPAEITFRH